MLGAKGYLSTDIEAMKLLYGNPDDLIEVGDILKSKGESMGEINNDVQNPSKSKGENNKSKIISLLTGNGKLTLPELAERLNLSIGGVEKIVRQLKKEGFLSRKGSTKAGEWVVKKGI